MICYFEKPQDSIKFFGRIHRKRSCPFWVEKQLILRPEFSALGSPHNTSIFEESNMNSNSHSDSYDDSGG